jgi:diguanylate cyclase (GGDEF)-like protein
MGLSLQQRFAAASLVAVLGAFLVLRAGGEMTGRSALVLAVLWVVLQGFFLAVAGRLRRFADEKERLALYDPVTELPNRVLFVDRVQQAILRARRDNSVVAIMLVDLDRFKEVNDTLGHHEGDQLLARVGARLRRLMRASDSTARLGGDEFAVCLSSINDADGAVIAAGRVHAALADPFELSGIPLAVGASIGVALFPEHGDDAETLIQRADVAMYLAKESASDCEIYAPERDRSSPERLALVAELRDAISADELVIYYQPKLELATGRVSGVEALVRWQHPQRGLVPPGDFIPIAERTGLHGPLTIWVLDEALRQVAHWSREGLRLTVAVNLSARTLHDPTLPEQVAGLLRRHEVGPDQLELEITESALISDFERARTLLLTLRTMGVRVALDDFGVGFGSLSYLRQVPVDVLKIDRSFVMTMEAQSQDAAIVRSTIALAHNLGLSAVAEGVESEAVLRELDDYGCDMAQGFHLSRPLPAAELEAWLVKSGVTNGGTNGFGLTLAAGA